MTDESAPPQHDGEFDGYRAAVSTGLKPRFWHYHLHDTGWRTAYVFLFLVAPLGLLVLWGGTRLFDVHHYRTLLLGLALCGVGGLMVLLGPLVTLGMAWSARNWARQFRDGLLIPGVVVSSKPLVVVGLADLGKTERAKGSEFGLARTDIWNLPGFSREVGTRVPCVAKFSEAGRDRFFYFGPYPVPHGTGDAFDIQQCFQRLGEAPFRRMEALVARDLTPEHWNRMVVVNANDEVIETRGYMAAGEMSKADLAETPASKPEEA